MNCTIGNQFDYEGEPGQWYWIGPSDFSIYNKKRRKKCFSCNDMIELNSYVAEFQRGRSPYSDIEAAICGDEILMAPIYFCEKCADIYFNLEDLGYNVSLMNMNEALEEYQDIINFNNKETS